MASKRELAAEAAELGQKLGVEVSVEGLNHAQLSELVERLRADLAAREGGSTPPEAPPDPPAPPDTPEPEAPPAPAEPARQSGKRSAPVDGAAPDGFGGKPPAPPAPEPKKSYPYTVAPGRTIQCPRGDIRAGREIRARDLVSSDADIKLGEEHLRALVSAGAVLKRP